MGEKNVEESIKLVDCGNVYLENETILSSHSMTFHYLRDLQCKVRNLREMARIWADSYICRDGQAQSGRINIKSISPDYAGIF